VQRTAILLVRKEHFKVIVLLLAEAADVDVWTDLDHDRMAHYTIQWEGERGRGRDRKKEKTVAMYKMALKRMMMMMTTMNKATVISRCMTSLSNNRGMSMMLLHSTCHSINVLTAYSIS